MKRLDPDLITAYVEEHIGTFHRKRLDKLGTLNLKMILKRKNPYLFRAKNIYTAQELIETLLDAFLSSHEETIFGDFLEGLAIYINQQVYGGRKSTAEGIDLEFDKEGTRYIVSIKSGPYWGNSSQIARMKDNFSKAKRILGTNRTSSHVIAVNGCCYGRDDSPDKAEYLKLCGQRFWEFISGDPDLYTTIIEPLGHRAKEEDISFRREKGQLINRLTMNFSQEFCGDNGEIDWEKLVQFNSGIVSR